MSDEAGQGGGRIVIGRDMRESSPVLAAAFADGNFTEGRPGTWRSLTAAASSSSVGGRVQSSAGSASCFGGTAEAAEGPGAAAPMPDVPEPGGGVAMN